MMQGSSTVVLEGPVAVDLFCSSSDFAQFGFTVGLLALVFVRSAGGRLEREEVESQREQARTPVEERVWEVPQKGQKGKEKEAGAAEAGIGGAGGGEDGWMV